jgi:two-component system, NarL family, sensor kinase
VDGTARLTVADDGVGVSSVDGTVAVDPGHRLGEGHIGLASHALRVEAAGGTLTVAPGTPRGTLATVELPLPGGSGPSGT